MLEGYDVAQVCINGHVTNSSSMSMPEFDKKFCDECGAGTITKCPVCSENIKGKYHTPGLVDFSPFYPPKFCDNCGTPFPWTKSKLTEAKELTQLSDTLSAEEKTDFNESLENLVKNTKVPVAEVKVKKYLGKVGKEMSKAMRDILVDIVSESIKKSLWG